MRLSSTRVYSSLLLFYVWVLLQQQGHSLLRPWTIFSVLLEYLLLCASNSIFSTGLPGSSLNLCASNPLSTDSTLRPLGFTPRWWCFDTPRGSPPPMWSSLPLSHMFFFFLEFSGFPSMLEGPHSFPNSFDAILFNLDSFLVRCSLLFPSWNFSFSRKSLAGLGHPPQLVAVAPASEYSLRIAAVEGSWPMHDLVKQQN